MTDVPYLLSSMRASGWLHSTRSMLHACLRVAWVLGKVYIARKNALKFIRLPTNCAESTQEIIMGDQQNNQVTAEVWTPEQQTQELKRRIGLVMSQFNAHEKPSFKPNPDDVIVAMPPKNGTTWLMHICHQIRMKGQEPDFEDQMDVISLIEASEKLFGVNPGTQPQPAKPRVFGTHLQYPFVPEEGKRIFSFRNQKDAVISAYHFFNSGLSLKGRVSLPIFAQVYIQQIEKHITDLVTWWERRHDNNVLLL